MDFSSYSNEINPSTTPYYFPKRAPRSMLHSVWFSLWCPIKKSSSILQCSCQVWLICLKEHIIFFFRSNFFPGLCHDHGTRWLTFSTRKYSWISCTNFYFYKCFIKFYIFFWSREMKAKVIVFCCIHNSEDMCYI